MTRWPLAGVLLLAALAPAHAQFLETFDAPRLAVDPSGLEGWSFFSGDGEAVIEFVASNEGYASILVDATDDRRNVWWALIKRRVSEEMDLERLSRDGWELRVEARVRASQAPRRINLHVNTQRTTDFHSHLMEYDIPEAGVWRTISMTTHGFPVRPGDTVFAQMALMDWGLGRYRVDVDYLKVDVVEATSVGPDLGEPIPYHPPLADPESFRHRVAAIEAAVIDLDEPDANLGSWSALDGLATRRVLTVGGTLWTVLRWNLETYRGQQVAGSGLLELTTESLLRTAEERKDFGLVRVVEILGGDPEWRRESVTLDSLAKGQALEEVFNPQMIIDWPLSERPGAKTWMTIPPPVLQRLVDGRTLGLALTPLGSISASLMTREGPQLLFDTEHEDGR